MRKWVLSGMAVIGVAMILVVVLRAPVVSPEKPSDANSMEERQAAPASVPVIAETTVELPAPEPATELPNASHVGMLRGQVIQPDGHPAAGAEVRYTWKRSVRQAPLEDSDAELSAPGTGPAWTDEAGHFEIGALPRGELYISADHETGHVTTRRQVTADHPLHEITLVLQGGMSLGGKVVGRDGKGIGGAKIMRLARNGRGIWGYKSEGGAVLSDDTGTFQLRSLEPGEWTLHASAAGYGSVITAPLPTGIDNARIVLSEGAALPCQVVRQADGSPVAGIAVTLAYKAEDLTPARLISDGEGLATFTAVGAGRYVLDIEDPHYALAGPPIELTIDPSRKPDRVTLHVMEGGEIRGHLLDGATGAGIPDRVIRAWEQTRDHSYASSATNEDGAYVLSGLPQGTYTVSPPNRVPGYPQDPPIRQRETVALAAGQVSEGVDFTLTAGATLAGIVLDDAGNPVEGATVRSNAVEGRQNLAEFYTQADGRFYFGDYSEGEAIHLVAETPASRSGLVGPFVVGAPGSDDITLSLALDCSGVIAGRVVNRSGEPFSCKVMALATEESLQFPVMWPVGETDGGGYFVLPNVCAGTYTIELVPRSNARQQARTVAVSPGESVLGLSLVYDQGELLELSGVVEDTEGNRIAGAHVRAGLDSGQGISPPAMTTAGEGGEFLFEELPAGTYSVSANAAGYARSEDAKVAAGETGVVVVMIGAPQVSGTVTGADGAPLGAFILTIQVSEGIPRNPIVHHIADAGGHFSVDLPGQGKWTLRVEAEGHLPAEVDLGRVYDEMEIADIEIALQQAP